VEIKRLSTPEELSAGYQVLKELRKGLSPEKFAEIRTEAERMDGYTLMGAWSDGSLAGVMGYRFQYDFVRGKHLYIDDLVTTESMRGKGVGAELLRHAERIARENQCSVLRLCAVLENEGGLRFYQREGWTRRAFAFQKSV
jgi:GNAT superfamily N-acetyltransferase